MSPAPFSHDQAVKNLIKAYPEEALEFLAQDVVAAHGKPVHIEFLDTTVTKDDTGEPGPGMAMDLAIRYVFADGHGVLFVLVEHWSAGHRLNLLRTARYYLDLCRRYPEDEVLPIALVDDDHTCDLKDTIQRGAMGEIFLSFRTRIVQVPSLDLEQFRQTRNRVALSFLPNMRGDLDPVERVLHVVVAFQKLNDTGGLRRFFALWIVEARLRIEQERELDRRLKEMDMPEIFTWWVQEGIAEGEVRGERKKALDAAHKMREHGISWEIVTDVTGLKPEELE